MIRRGISGSRPGRLRMALENKESHYGSWKHRCVCSFRADVGSIRVLLRGGETAAQQPNSPPPVPAGTKQYASPPPMTINPDHKYTATIDTTKGKIVAELFPKDAPLTVNNFVFSSREGFYNGIVFHRVVRRLHGAGGRSNGHRARRPAVTRSRTKSARASRKHKVGSLSMANAGPGTNGSQFFITHVARPIG